MILERLQAHAWRIKSRTILFFNFFLYPFIGISLWLLSIVIDHVRLVPMAAVVLIENNRESLHCWFQSGPGSLQFLH